MNALATITASSADKSLVNPVLIQGLIRQLEMKSQSAGLKGFGKLIPGKLHGGHGQAWPPG